MACSGTLESSDIRTNNMTAFTTVISTIRTGRLLTLLVLLGTTLAACEQSPTDYDDAHSISSTPLTKVLLRNGTQTIAVNGLVVESFPLGPTNLLDLDSLFTLEGTIDRIGTERRISFDLDVRFPETGIFALNRFDEPQPRGFTIELDSLKLQTNANNLHSTDACPQSAASMKLATLESDTSNGTSRHVWTKPQIIPAVAELNLQLIEVDNKIVGDITITGTYRAPGGSILFYDLKGTIEME